MTKLDPGDGHCVLINTFRVKDGRADELVALLARATESAAQRMPGFVSANLHVSLDRQQVVNYAQWRSKADFDAAMQDADFQEHMHGIQAVITSFEPVLYELRYSHAV